MEMLPSIDGVETLELDSLVENSRAEDSAAENSFDQFGLSDSIRQSLVEAGFTTPTPIQAAAIPHVLAGSDLMGFAQTGTGKTGAFVLPLLEKLIRTPRQGRGVRALILAPTRELADQINQVFMTFGKKAGIRTLTIFGGVAYNRQFEGLRRDPEVIVACPGRLLDHIERRSVDLSSVETLILDEADRMFDMGFLPVVRRIVKVLPKKRQTMLFSATMPPEVEKLAEDLLTDPEIVRISTERPVAQISHGLFAVDESDKHQLLHGWLEGNPESMVVIFTKMKHTARRISEKLEDSGHAATALHGNLSQGRRKAALTGFRNGEYRILVATDIAARGIDVDGVSHVINFDMPENLDAYIHRVGRAGRASRSGNAISFVTRRDRSMIRSIERWLNGPLEQLSGVTVTPGARSEGQNRDDRPRPARSESSGPRSGPRSDRPRGRGEGRPFGGGSFRDGRRDDRGGHGQRDFGSRPPRGPRNDDRRERDDFRPRQPREFQGAERQPSGDFQPRGPRTNQRRDGDYRPSQPRGFRSDDRGGNRDFRPDQSRGPRSAERSERDSGSRPPPRSGPRNDNRPFGGQSRGRDDQAPRGRSSEHRGAGPRGGGFRQQGPRPRQAFR
jgi:ATP-dependent RNA helicase RhlE